jgi:thiol-disulfide isomerase/thioredoxin
MKYLTLLALIVSLSFMSCKQEPAMTFEDFQTAFHRANDSIKVLSYHMHRIDTFADGAVWDNKGFAHLERSERDTIFGFNFYAKRDDVPQMSIYDQGKCFDLDMEEMVYELTPGGYYFTGSPGGQMVSAAFFELDKSYETVTVRPLNEGWEVVYSYPDDSLYMITNRSKTLHVDTQFLPVSQRVSLLNQGEKSSTTMLYSDIKVNEAIQKDMEAYKELIKDYELLQEESYEPSDYLGTPLPALVLTNIETGETKNFKTDKILLIDFWEVWCGWCIKSFPEVDRLAQTYKDDLEVIGIATESKEKALQLIESKGISFTNYFEDQDLLDRFKIRSWPTYILVNSQGLMVKEYFGFSEAIESDIKNLIDEGS